MSGLPEGWAWSTLLDVAEWSSGGTPKAGTPEYYGGGVPWAVIGDLNDGRVSVTASTITDEGLLNSSAKVVQAGTVLVAMYGSIGKLGIAEVAMATNQAIACAATKACVSRDWLFWWLRSQREDLLAAGKGGTQSNISQTVLKAWPIPVAPLAEQQRIVGAIEEAFSKLDAGEAGLRNVRLLLKRMRDAVLSAAVTGRLVPQDPADTPASKLLAGLGVEPIEPPDGVPGLPDGWAWAALGSISDSVRNGIFVSRPPEEPPGVPILRIGSVRRLELDLDQVRYAPVDISDPAVRRALLEPGDLLFTRYNGNPEFVGACAVVPDVKAPLLHPDKLIRVVVNRLMTEPRYVAITVSTGPSRAFIERATKTTAGQSGVSGSDLKLVPIPVPPPAEQARIVAEVDRQLSDLRACERSIEAGLERSAALRRAVLKAAFAGQLVAQDPTDEPASVLLERIRAEREAAPKAKTPRRPRKAANP